MAMPRIETMQAQLKSYKRPWPILTIDPPVEHLMREVFSSRSTKPAPIGYNAHLCWDHAEWELKEDWHFQKMYVNMSSCINKT